MNLRLVILSGAWPGFGQAESKDPYYEQASEESFLYKGPSTRSLLGMTGKQPSLRN